MEDKQRHPTILIADTEIERYANMTESLIGEGCRVIAARTALETIQNMEKYITDVAIVNTTLEDMNAVGLIPIIRGRFPDVKIIVVAEQNMAAHEKIVRPWGIVTFLLKPIDMNILEEIALFAAEGRSQPLLKGARHEGKNNSLRR